MVVTIAALLIAAVFSALDGSCALPESAPPAQHDAGADGGGDDLMWFIIMAS